MGGGKDNNKLENELYKKIIKDLSEAEIKTFKETRAIPTKKYESLSGDEKQKYNNYKNSNQHKGEHNNQHDSTKKEHELRTKIVEMQLNAATILQKFQQTIPHAYAKEDADFFNNTDLHIIVNKFEIANKTKDYNEIYFNENEIDEIDEMNLKVKINVFISRLNENNIKTFNKLIINNTTKTNFSTINVRKINTMPYSLYISSTFNYYKLYKINSYEELIKHIKEIREQIRDKYQAKVDVEKANYIAYQQQIDILIQNLNNLHQQPAAAAKTEDKIELAALLPPVKPVDFAVATAPEKKETKAETGMLDSLKHKYPQHWHHLNDLHNQTDLIRQDYENAKEVIMKHYDERIEELQNNIRNSSNYSSSSVEKIIKLKQKREDELTEEHEHFLKKDRENRAEKAVFLKRAEQIMKLEKPKPKESFATFRSNTINIDKQNDVLQYYLKQLEDRGITIQKMKTDYTDIFETLQKNLIKLEQETDPYNPRASKTKIKKIQKEMVYKLHDIVERHDSKVKRFFGEPQRGQPPPQQQHNKHDNKQGKPEEAGDFQKVQLTDEFLKERIAKGQYYPKDTNPETLAALKKNLIEKKMFPFKKNGKLYTHDKELWQDNMICADNSGRCKVKGEHKKGGGGSQRQLNKSIKKNKKKNNKTAKRRTRKPN